MRFVTLCLITGILIIFSGCTSALLASNSSLDSGKEPTSPGASTDNSSQSVIPLPIGLSGTITADIVVDKLAPDAENTVFIGTSTGLYLTSDGSIDSYIYTPAPVTDFDLLNDFTGDGIQEIVICLSSTCYPGVQCYDGASGEELWHFMPTHEAVIAGFNDIQTLCIDLETIADWNGDSVKEVAVASGRSLYMIDGKTGEQIWMFEADSIIEEDAYITNNLVQIAIAGDVDGDGTADLISAGEGGYLYVVSGNSGKLIRKTRLFDNYSNDELKEESTFKSVGNIICFQFDGRNKAAVSLNGDRTVYLIDLQNGSTEWESSPIYSSNSIDVILSLSDDVTGDNVSDILAIWEASSTAGVSLINGYNGTTVWNTTTSTQNDTPKASITTMDGEYSVLAPLGRTGTFEGVAILNIENGELSETLEISSVAAVSDPDTIEHWAIGFDGNSFILASDDADLSCISAEGERLWRLPRISDLAVKKGQFNSNSASDLLLCCDRVLSVRDSLTLKELWQYILPYDSLSASGGVGSIQVIPDINSDQFEDILACQGENILLFDGNTGDILLNYSVDDQITSLNTMTGKGGSTLLIAGTATDIFVIKSDGTQLCSQPYSTWIAEEDSSEYSFLVLDDLTGDGISDLAVASEDTIILVESSQTGSDLTYTAGSTVIQPDNTGSIISQDLATDIDGDGYKDIYLRVTKTVEEETLIYSIIISPSSGEALLELDEESGLFLDPGCADFNDDGYPDSIAYWIPLSETSETLDRTESEDGKVVIGTVSPTYDSQQANTKLKVLSGQDQSTLWEHEYGYMYGSASISGDNLPAIPFYMEGSEVPYLLYTDVYRDEYYVTTEMIKVVNILDNKTVKEFTVTKQSSGGSIPVNDYTADSGTSSISYTSSSLSMLVNTAFGIGDSGDQSSPVQLLKDLDGDGTQEIALFEQQYAETSEQWQRLSDEETHPVIVNVAGEEVMSYFLLPCSELTDLSDPGLLGMLGDNELFYVLDTICDLEITSPGAGASLSSPISTSWQGTVPNYFNLIYIDNTLSKISHESKVTVEIKPGSHKITVYSLDRYGRVSMQNTNIQVKSQPLYLLLAVALIVLSIAALYSARIIRIFDKRQLRKSGK